MIEPQSWQCGGCKTWYAPFVEKCECEHDSTDYNFRFTYDNGLTYRYMPQPSQENRNPVITWAHTEVTTSPEKAREWFLQNGIRLQS